MTKNLKILLIILGVVVIGGFGVLAFQNLTLTEKTIIDEPVVDGDIDEPEEEREKSNEIQISESTFEKAEKFCYSKDEVFSLKKASYLKKENNGGERVVGICSSRALDLEEYSLEDHGISGDILHILFVLDINGENITVLTTKDGASAQRLHHIESFQINDIENDGNEDVFASATSYSINARTYKNYIYSPKHDEWFFSESDTWQDVDKGITSGEFNTISYEYSENLKNEKFSLYKEFLQGEKDELSREDCSKVSIGERCGGGVVVYHDNEGGGLIASLEDTTSWWGCFGVDIKNTSEDYGSGASNTTLILESCNEKGTDFAASKCNRMYSDGYYDWFLPSKKELEYLYKEKENIGGNFKEEAIVYWSSTQKDYSSAWLMAFDPLFDVVTDADKRYLNGVRCTRYFGNEK